MIRFIARATTFLNVSNAGNEVHSVEEYAQIQESQEGLRRIPLSPTLMRLSLNAQIISSMAPGVIVPIFFVRDPRMIFAVNAEMESKG